LRTFASGKETLRIRPMRYLTTEIKRQRNMISQIRIGATNISSSKLHHSGVMSAIGRDKEPGGY
jgi:hypothetical protein